MKYLILSLLAVVFLPISLSSQLSVGFEGGVTLLFTSTTVVDDPFSPIAGVSIGVPLTYRLSDKVAIGLTTSYMQRIQRARASGGVDDWNRRYDYIQFTPNVQYFVRENLAFGLGGYYASLFQEYIRFGARHWRENGFSYPDDYGITGSVSYFFKIYSFNLRYHHGLNDRFKNRGFFDENGNFISGTKQFHRTMELTVSFSLSKP